MARLPQVARGRDRAAKSAQVADFRPYVILQFALKDMKTPLVFKIQGVYEARQGRLTNLRAARGFGAVIIKLAEG